MQVKLVLATKKATMIFHTPQEVQQHYQSYIVQTGFFLPTDKVLSLFESIDLVVVFQPLEEQIELKAQVVRIVDEAEAQQTGQQIGIALFLTDLNQSHLDQILKWTQIDLSNLENSLKESVSEDSIDDLEPDFTQISDELSQEEENFEDLVAQEDLSNEPEAIRRKTLFDQIRGMKPPEKIRLAPKADRAERAVLIRDNDPNVLFFLCKNPKITQEEIKQIVKNPKITQPTFEFILQNPQWMRSDEIKFLIVTNNKVSTQFALKLMPFLNKRQVRDIAKNQHIRAPIKNAAVKLALKNNSE